MVYWKGARNTTSPFAPVQTAEQEQNEMSRLTALEIVVLVVTFLAFVGQFINLAYALIDHGNLQRLTAEVRRGLKPA